jgi:hypothetical protein
MKPRKCIASLGGAAAVVCSRTRAAALPTDRPICNARVPRAVGESFKAAVRFANPTTAPNQLWQIDLTYLKGRLLGLVLSVHRAR